MSFSSLIDYKRVLISLVIELRRLRDISEKLNIDNSIQLLDDVLTRIENDSFSIAVVGEFKRGKSTFINALLGREILPSDILPCSATLNRVTYGLNKLVKIKFKNGREQEIGEEQLTNYVTRLTPQSSATANCVKEAVVYYPTPFCRNNVDIIDTPGLSDDENMSAVTLSVLPVVDAAVMVIMATAPFSESERDFLENKLLTNDLARVMFVVTGIDYFNRPEDADRVVKSIEGRIKRHVIERVEQQFGRNSEQYNMCLRKIGKLKVFGLSAYQALQAKKNGHAALLTQSRFSFFEAALEKFLTQERGAIALQVPVNRAIAVSKEILKTISGKERTLETMQTKFKAAYEAAVAKIAADRQAHAVAVQRRDAAVKSMQQRIQLLLNQVEAELKHVAGGTIDSAPLTPVDFHESNIAALMLNLDCKVAEGLEITSRKLAGRIQIEIRRGLASSADGLQFSTNEVRQILNNIGMHFVQLGSLLKTAIVDSRIALRVASTSTGGLGGWLNQNLFGSNTVETFKVNYKQAIVQEIAFQLQSNSITQKVNDYILTTFDIKKRETHQGVESLLDDTHDKIAQLRGEQARDETLIENQCRRLSEMREETQKILGNAQKLSQQLAQILDV